MPVVLRERAHQDLLSGARSYLEEAGVEVAGQFVRSVERTLDAVAFAPDAGSHRAGFLLEIPALRSWPMTAFPWTVFYIRTERGVEVWRILHQRVDLPTWFEVP